MNKKNILIVVLAFVACGLLMAYCGQDRRPVLERVAELEHEQWMEWSKAVAPEVSPERRARWEQYWVPYEELPDSVKEQDRVYARRVIREVRRGR